MSIEEYANGWDFGYSRGETDQAGFDLSFFLAAGLTWFVVTGNPIVLVLAIGLMGVLFIRARTWHRLR